MVRSTLLPGENRKNGGPTASVALRPKSDFLKEVSGTPAQTALAHTSPWKDLPITVVKSGIGPRNAVNSGQKLKSDLHEMVIFWSKIDFFKKCPDRSESGAKHSPSG